MAESGESEIQSQAVDTRVTRPGYSAERGWLSEDQWVANERAQQEIDASKTPSDPQPIIKETPPAKLTAEQTANLPPFKPLKLIK